MAKIQYGVKPDIFKCAECGMTLKMMGKTDLTAGRATATCVTWMRDHRGCNSCVQKA